MKKCGKAYAVLILSMGPVLFGPSPAWAMVADDMYVEHSTEEPDTGLTVENRSLAESGVLSATMHFGATASIAVRPETGSVSNDNALVHDTSAISAPNLKAVLDTAKTAAEQAPVLGASVDSRPAVVDPALPVVLSGQNQDANSLTASTLLQRPQGFATPAEEAPGTLEQSVSQTLAPGATASPLTKNQLQLEHPVFNIVNKAGMDVREVETDPVENQTSAGERMLRIAVDSPAATQKQDSTIPAPNALDTPPATGASQRSKGALAKPVQRESGFESRNQTGVKNLSTENEYASEFYVRENIVGYTGVLSDNPTVYFSKATGGKSTQFGHITQKHGNVENEGRELVLGSDNYQIVNVEKGTRKRAEEYIGSVLIHKSRNEYIPVNQEHTALDTLAQAIASHTTLKSRYLNGKFLPEFVRGNVKLTHPVK